MINALSCTGRWPIGTSPHGGQEWAGWVAWRLDPIARRLRPVTSRTVAGTGTPPPGVDEDVAPLAAASASGRRGGPAGDDRDDLPSFRVAGPGSGGPPSPLLRGNQEDH